MKLTREQLAGLQAPGMRVLKSGGAAAAADAAAPKIPDYTGAMNRALEEVERMNDLVDRLSTMNSQQFRRVEALLTVLAKPAAAAKPARRLKVNRNARGFIESIDVEEVG